MHIEWMITPSRTNLDKWIFPWTNASQHVIYNHVIRPLDKVGLSITLHLGIGEEENEGFGWGVYLEVHVDHLKVKDEGPGIPS